MSLLVYKHPLRIMSKSKTKQNGVYCVCASVIFPGYQVKSAFHLDQIKTTRTIQPEILSSLRLLAGTFSSLFYVLCEQCQLSVSLGNIYFNSCFDKHPISHLLVKASNQSARYCEHLIQAQECMLGCEWQQR